MFTGFFYKRIWKKINLFNRLLFSKFELKPWRICWSWRDCVLHILQLLQPEDNLRPSSWDFLLVSTLAPNKTWDLSFGNSKQIKLELTRGRPTGEWLDKDKDGFSSVSLPCYCQLCTCLVVIMLLFILLFIFLFPFTCTCWLCALCPCF